MAAKEKVTIHPAGERDQFGDPIPGTDQPFPLQAVVIPRHSSEDASRGTVTISGYQLIIKPPPTRAVTSSDQVTVRGVKQPIEGVPGLYLGKALEIFTRGVNQGS